MSQQFWTDFFENKARSKDKNNSFSVNGFVDPRQAGNIRKLILNLVKNIYPSYLIDCGCGDGSVALMLTDHCEELVGIEISPTMSELASQRGVKVVNDSIHSILNNSSVLNKLISDKPRRNMLFLFCESLVCIDNPNKVINEISNTFPDVGYFLISSPNQDSLFRQIFKASATSKLNYVDFEFLDQSLTENSYRMIKKIYIFGIPYLFSIGIEWPNAIPKSLEPFINKVSNNIICLLSLKP